MTDHEPPVETVQDIIDRDLPVYVPSTVLEYVGFTDSPVSKAIYEHITKRPETIISFRCINNNCWNMGILIFKGLLGHRTKKPENFTKLCKLQLFGCITLAFLSETFSKLVNLSGKVYKQ